ncbi:DUF4402 domain-containing protein [Pseudomonadota bacterium]
MLLKNINIPYIKLPFFVFVFLLFSCLPFSEAFSAMTIDSTTDMDFGQVVSGSSSSILTLDLVNTVTVDSGDATLPSFSTPSSGSLSLSGAKKSKAVTFVCQSTSPPSGVTYGTLAPASVDADASGAVNTALGITITINASLSSGTYNGTCTVLATDSTSSPQTDTAVVNVLLEIVAPASVDPETTALAFGSILPDTSGGSIDVSSAGAISNNSGTATFFGGHSAAQFNVTGHANNTVYITYSSGDVLTGPGTDMGLGTFTDNTTGGALTLSSGSATLNVGARLTYSASQTAGNYSGTYTVNANY